MTMTERGRSRSRERSSRRTPSPTSRGYREIYDTERRVTRDRRDYRSSSRSRSRSPHPARQKRHHSHSSSRSRSVSPRRDRKTEKGRHGRYRSRSRSRSRIHRRYRSRSPSTSSSSSSDSDRHHRDKKRRKDGHQKRSKSRHRKEKKEKKEKKKAKKDKKKKKAASGSHWGKYGIINESNMYEKEAEFRTWLVEERMINPEVLSKEQTKKEFLKFAEDYNTATLPHEKYYDITSYERRLQAIRSGETLPPAEAIGSYDPNADLRAHSSHFKFSKQSSSTHAHGSVDAEGGESYLNREHLEELRRVQRERNQVGKMKLMGMNIGQSFGVRMDGNEFE